jgi:hypothetical protein
MATWTISELERDVATLRLTEITLRQPTVLLGLPPTLPLMTSLPMTH